MTPIRVTRILSSVPDARGRLAVLLANGRTTHIPASLKGAVLKRSAEELTASPNGTVVGSCGSSYVEVAEKENEHPVRMTTGFTLVLPAVYYDWSVQESGPDYSYHYASSGFLAEDVTWNGSHDSDKDYLAGTYSAAVDATSTATLDDGETCTNLAPTASTELTSPDTSVNNLVTPDTMSKKQLDRVSKLKEMAEGISASADGITEVTRLTDDQVRQFPNSAVVLLLILRADDSMVTCSGFLYGDDMVATAGHCLYSAAAGGWDSIVYAVPGSLSDGTSVQDGCGAVEMWSSTGYVNDARPEYDYGALELGCTISGPTFTLNAPENQDDAPPSSVTSNGYSHAHSPQAVQYTGTGDLGNYNQRGFRFDVDILGGMSGGPVYTGAGDVAGINAQGGDGTVPTAGLAARITQANLVNFNGWADGSIE